MNLVPQVQFQLFGRPSWLAGRRTFETSWSGHVLAGTIASTSLTRAVDVPQPRSIGSNFLEDQSSGFQITSLAHCVSPPVRVSLEHEGFRGCAINSEAVA